MSPRDGSAPTGRWPLASGPREGHRHQGTQCTWAEHAAPVTPPGRTHRGLHASLLIRARVTRSSRSHPVVTDDAAGGRAESVWPRQEGRSERTLSLRPPVAGRHPPPRAPHAGGLPWRTCPSPTAPAPPGGAGRGSNWPDTWSQQSAESRSIPRPTRRSQRGGWLGRGAPTEVSLDWLPGQPCPQTHGALGGFGRGGALGRTPQLLLGTHPPA